MDEPGLLRIMGVEDAARTLGISPRSLRDKRFRARIGLAAVYIGRRIGFEEQDIHRLITDGREQVPARTPKKEAPDG